MQRRLCLDAALAALSDRQAVVVAGLRASNGDPALLEAKRQLDDAVACLRLCERYQIHPDAKVQALPASPVAFGGFVVLAVDEAGEPLSMTPVQAAGRSDGPLELDGGDLIVQQNHVFNLPNRPERPNQP